MLTFAFFLVAFLLGSIPAGYVIGRFYGVDLRKEGSGNIGATNAKRVLGNKAGLYTLLFDLGKGAAAVLFAQLYVYFAGEQYLEAEALLRPFMGFAAIVGHCYSPFMGFKGGKGVATSLGVFLVLAPVAALISVVAFALVYRLSGYVSLSSLSATTLFALLIFFSVPHKYSGEVALAAILSAGVVIIRHRENISRLMAGTELPTKQKGTQPEAN